MEQGEQGEQGEGRVGNLVDELVVNRSTMVALLVGLLFGLACLMGFLIWVATAMPGWVDIKRYFAEKFDEEWF